MNPATPQVLVVEDEAEIRRFVRIALQGEGFRVVESGTLAEAVVEAATCKPDLVILDLGLPDGDGTTFVARLRNWSTTPVLILSARSTEDDKIEVLDAGADDYLVKPFSVGELLARVRALLRRSRVGAEGGNPVVRFGRVEADLARHDIRRDGTAVHLTPIEFRLLALLVAGTGKVMTHRYLLREVWGPSYVGNSHYLRIVVGHLRQKLEDDPTRPQHFITETGVGYRFQT